jgi:hypothetical protein
MSVQPFLRGGYGCVSKSILYVVVLIALQNRLASRCGAVGELRSLRTRAAVLCKNENSKKCSLGCASPVDVVMYASYRIILMDFCNMAAIQSGRVQPVLISPSNICSTYPFRFWKHRGNYFDWLWSNDWNGWRQEVGGRFPGAQYTLCVALYIYIYLFRPCSWSDLDLVGGGDLVGTSVAAARLA